MKKIITALLIMMTMFSTALAKSTKTSITNLIRESGIPESSVSISIKDGDSGKTIYKLNDKILIPPASVLKTITLVPYVKTLGEEYELSTSIYSRGQDSYVIKLGADPYLSSGELKILVDKINKDTVKRIYIDDSIIEKKDWGEGWQWDDDLNPFMPRFNSYNLDKNIIKLTVMPTEFGKQAAIINPSKYPFAFYNSVITGTKNDVSIERDYDSNINKVILTGTVESPYPLTIPNNNLKRYFYLKLKEALANEGIYLSVPFTTSLLQNEDKLLAEVKHPLSDAVSDILINSNNLAIESVSKIAAARKYKKTGTDTDAIRLFEEYCSNHGIDTSGINIVDASGVSKNNLLYADFISGYLLKNKDNSVLKQLAHTGEGTLVNRLIPLKDNLRAKTGTLSNISAIAGFLTTKKGNNYIFCIMINDPKSTPSTKKTLEDYILREIYLKM